MFEPHHCVYLPDLLSPCVNLKIEATREVEQLGNLLLFVCFGINNISTSHYFPKNAK